MDDTFLIKLQEIEEMFLKTQGENKTLEEANRSLKLDIELLQEQIGTLSLKIKELETTQEQSAKGIQRVWSRVFGN